MIQTLIYLGFFFVLLVKQHQVIASKPKPKLVTSHAIVEPIGVVASERIVAVLKDFQKTLEERTQFHLGYPYNLDFDYSALEPLQQFSINNLGDPSSGRAMKPSLSVGSWHVSAVLLT
jgi:hypothetical protein